MCSSYAFLRLECSLLRWRRTAARRRFVCLHFMNVCQLQLSSGISAPNSGNNHHLTIPFEGGMHSFKREGACVKGKALVGPSVTEEQVEQVRQAFVRSPRKSTVRGSRELGIPQPTEEEEAKTETISPNAATKITTRRSPLKDDFLH